MRGTVLSLLAAAESLGAIIGTLPHRTTSSSKVLNVSTSTPVADEMFNTTGFQTSRPYCGYHRHRLLSDEVCRPVYDRIRLDLDPGYAYDQELEWRGTFESNPIRYWEYMDSPCQVELFVYSPSYDRFSYKDMYEGASTAAAKCLDEQLQGFIRIGYTDKFQLRVGVRRYFPDKVQEANVEQLAQKEK